MTKILLIMPYFYPHKGGSQKYAEELYVHLIKNFPNKYQVDILCYNTDNAPKRQIYRNLNLIRIPCWQLIPARFALPHPWALISTLIKLAKNNYQFVNSQLIFFDPCWWTWLYARLIGAKSIFTEHVATYPVHQSKLVEIISHLVDQTIGRFSVHRYHLITATNKAAINFLNITLNIKKDIKLIYGGVDTTYFSPPKTKPKKIYITYVGRVIWTKGISLFYDSIKDLLPKIPSNIHFNIVGGGELEKQLHQQIESDQLSSRITLTGFVPYQKVRQYLRSSTIFVNPSHHNEGFPNTILEAGASQNFVIATDNAGTTEVIKHLKTGYIIPQKDQKALKKALIWAINHPHQRQIIARNLRHLMVNRFDWNIITTQYHQLLSDKT